MGQRDPDLENLIFRLNSELKEDKTERNARKNYIRNVMSRLAQYAVGNDSRYTQEIGIVSRGYRGLGTYGKDNSGHFDVQIPLIAPEGANIGKRTVKVEKIES